MPFCRSPIFKKGQSLTGDPYTKANADVRELFDMYDSEGGLSGLYAPVTGRATPSNPGPARATAAFYWLDFKTVQYWTEVNPSIDVCSDGLREKHMTRNQSQLRLIAFTSLSKAAVVEAGIILAPIKSEST